MSKFEFTLVQTHTLKRQQKLSSSPFIQFTTAANTQDVKWCYTLTSLLCDLKDMLEKAD